MRKLTGATFAALVIGTCITNGARSQDSTGSINITTTAVPFLRISPDARSGGMGDAGIATTPDINSGFWNLAKLPYVKSKMGVAATYTPWLKDLGLNDVYLTSLTGFTKVDELSAVALNLRYFSLGNIQFTNSNGDNLTSARPYELGIDVGYTRKLSNFLSIGVAGRYILSSLANGDVNNSGTVYKAGTAVAADISLYKAPSGENGDGLSWGVVLSNLGSKIGYTDDALNKDYIPANLGLGLGYLKFFDEDNKLSFAFDANKLLVPAPPTATNTTDYQQALVDYHTKSVVSSWFSSFGKSGGIGNELKLFQFSLGAEYVYADQFAVRLGYFYEDKSQGGRQYFTTGLGLKYNVMGINFSYLVPSGQGISRSPLSNTLRFGISFDLDELESNN